jgi:glycosyltransferase involved in cell wall biosynthesis
VQSLRHKVTDTDLLIFTHENRFILSHAYYLLPVVHRPKVAFWGHGWNHQAKNLDSLKERFKAWSGRRSHWYFAYTGNVRKKLIELGFDPERVTDVQNTVEAPKFTPDPRQIQSIRQEFGLVRTSSVALFCGRMYPMRRLDMLFEAAARVHEALPSFSLILAGGGPDEPIAEQAARDYDFVHCAGPATGARKASLFSVSRLCVMPGLVGLGVVDAFHHGVPPVATRFPYHSPEFAYLRDGQNGLIVDHSAEALSAAMLRLATDDVLHRQLVMGAKASSNELSMEEMVQRFTGGILAALGDGPD